MEKMKDIVHENLTTAQDRQKRWYPMARINDLIDRLGQST